jgi:hypothetical protein
MQVRDNKRHSYQRIGVYGHQRSGTHYLAALIDKNFYDGAGYLRHYAQDDPHALYNELSIRPDFAYVYIWRRFEDVARSIFRMRKRFGLNVDDFDTFLCTKYSDMWDPSAVGDVDVIVNTINEVIRVDKPAGQKFAGKQLTPEEYWRLHVGSWKQSGNENVFLINYDDLQYRFQEAMRQLADCIGADRANFIDVEQKVGWIPQ